MATKQEMALCAEVMRLCDAISSKGIALFNVSYSGVCEFLEVYAYEISAKGEVRPEKIISFAGWEACGHIIYLGADRWFGYEPSEKLQSLIDDLKALLPAADADGVPI